MRDRAYVPGLFLSSIVPLTVLSVAVAVALPRFSERVAAAATQDTQVAKPVPPAGIQTKPLDCPLLPGCPDGPSVPLPPSNEPTTGKQTENVPDGSGLTAGTGKYAGLVYVPGGPFNVGSPKDEGRPDEHPRHRVFLKPFYIAKHEVTTKEYCTFLNAQGDKSRDGLPRVKLDNPFCPIQKNGRYFQPKRGEEDMPVICVSWYGAADYAEWSGGRLPTSAEWEKAAALCTPYRPPDFLTILPRQDRSQVSIAAPGLRGITGMIGNVWEWCSDWYDENYYSASTANNPAGPPLGKEKVLRGGSWASPESSKRIKNLHKASPAGYYRTVGFRIVKD